jgi:hypothetical protein
MASWGSAAARLWRLMGVSPEFDTAFKRPVQVLDRCSGDHKGYGPLVERLIQRLPRDHVAGLDAVILVDQLSYRSGRRRGVPAAYSPHTAGGPAPHIELAIPVILAGEPPVARIIPLLRTVMIARMLYHEVGHHYHVVCGTGAGQRERERLAVEYQGQMLARLYPRTFLALRAMREVCRRFVKRSR